MDAFRADVKAALTAPVRKLDNDPADWSREAVTWATENDLLLGDAAGDLLLRSPLTREQFCVMLKRYHDHFIT